MIIKRLEAETKSAGGIVIPDTAAEKPIKGSKSSAVGRARFSKTARSGPVGVKAGEKVLFGKYSGTEVKVDGEELLVMREEDLMAVIEGWSKQSNRPSIPAKAGIQVFAGEYRKRNSIQPALG